MPFLPQEGRWAKALQRAFALRGAVGPGVLDDIFPGFQLNDPAQPHAFFNRDERLWHAEGVSPAAGAGTWSWFTIQPFSNRLLCITDINAQASATAIGGINLQLQVLGTTNIAVQWTDQRCAGTFPHRFQSGSAAALPTIGHVLPISTTGTASLSTRIILAPPIDAAQAAAAGGWPTLVIFHQTANTQFRVSLKGYDLPFDPSWVY